MGSTANQHYQPGILGKLLPCAAGTLRRGLGLLRSAPAAAAVASVVPVATPDPYNPTAKTTAPGCLWVGEVLVGTDSPAGLGGHPDIRY